ncbi:hypothetical protein S1OALGB6SA_1622 [Olavius algarvensis spirochete endosymbiont]|uniref:hypothetical protein n=1 Tax=Olavius algarvensis spirochete endosymbiont TaxID=260710 RepID=UPI000F26F7FF|nr:hypothetical protein [Olavius algarvensis spirochete endosymbiont]VDB00540.1 hypothetical protein S1OALGB6SA_1622 [Olavius algarvensis spirochete endosymbiont]
MFLNTDADRYIDLLIKQARLSLSAELYKGVDTKMGEAACLPDREFSKASKQVNRD